jgi:hypothetical protein
MHGMVTACSVGFFPTSQEYFCLAKSKAATSHQLTSDIFLLSTYEHQEGLHASVPTDGLDFIHMCIALHILLSRSRTVDQGL